MAEEDFDENFNFKEEIPKQKLDAAIYDFFNKIFKPRLQDYYAGKTQIITIPLSKIEERSLALSDYFLDHPAELLSLLRSTAEHIYGKDSNEAKLFKDRAVIIYVDENAAVTPKNVYSITTRDEGKLVLLEGVIRSVS